MTWHIEYSGECGEIRPQTFGYQQCWLPVGHAGAHRSQDGGEWGDARAQQPKAAEAVAS